MARSVSAVVLLLLLVAASGANAATKTAKAAGIKLILDLAAQPKRAPGMVFNDAWVAKINGTVAGNTYRPDTVDWASVIQAVRVICTYEMRICNWCTRAAFHDGGANSLDEVGATVGTKKGQVVTAPKGGGGLDASLLLTDEQLRTENAYDSFSTFTAAVIRSLVGFYDISYADGLAVCGATAREMLTYGQTPVYSMMPAVDTSYPGAKKLQTQDFLVGRLDQNVSNGAGILPGATFTSQQFVDWFEKHFARGAYDGVALLGSHALLDEQGCVKSAEIAGPFKDKQRMFAWNAPNTYYRELSGGGLMGPSPDQDSEDYFRTDAPPKPITLFAKERCKFTAPAFQDAAVLSVAAAMQAGTSVGRNPSFEWLDQDIHFSADPPGRMAIKQNGIPAVNPNTGASVLAIDPTTGQTIAPVAADEVVPHAPRPSGYRTHRTCDFAGNCYDGWPFTQNDGFMGQSTSNTSLSAPADVKVRTAVLAMSNRKTFDTAYGHAFVRLLNNGAMFSPAGPSKGAGYKITGWECSAWLAGDGTNKAKNLVCNVACRLPGGCPNLHMKLPVVPTATNCRCSSAPWGEVATQSLFPNSTQTAFGNITATPSGLGGPVAGRKLLAGSRHQYHSADLAAGSGGAKPKCPFARLRELGLVEGLF